MRFDQWPLLISLGISVNAHNWMTYPTPRVVGGNGLYGGKGQIANCGDTGTNIPTGNTFKRLQRLTPRWTWNNHWNGFVRFAIVPLGEENDLETMNNPNNFIKIACHTQNCGGRNGDLSGFDFDYFAPYNLPGQRGIPFDDSNPENECFTNLTIPSWLADGEYVLQWVIYGVHDSNAIMMKTLPFYRSCANIKIQGGAPLTTKSDSGCDFGWQGGDRALQDPENMDSTQCGYWRFNSVNATHNFYEPNELYDASGEFATDAKALRHGPPAEHEACKVGSYHKSTVSLNDSVSLPSHIPTAIIVHTSDSQSSTSKIEGKSNKQCRSKNIFRTRKLVLQSSLQQRFLARRWIKGLIW